MSSDKKTVALSKELFNELTNLKTEEVVPQGAAPKVNRLRSKAAEPTVQFAQRVTVETANGFYDYARKHNLKMKDVLSRAAKALREFDAVPAKDMRLKVEGLD